ncbi:uncharacterized protein [Amphiura filiformis]|uniref:uncharacterized protein n=1 Tax=Amphiura filiformis TaxID=82378 RepID=UPI003B21D1E7
MASSLAEKIDENFLQCGICLEPFKNPRALPCLHSFCEECLARWTKTNKKDDSKVLTCPNCMRPTPISAEGIAGFPAHFLVNSLQDTLNMEKVKDLSAKSCDQCEEPDKAAAVYCQDCKYYLCESCHDIHEAWKGNKSHTVLTGADMLSRKTSGKEQYCTEHDNVEQKFYCKTCDKPVCQNCIDSKQHCRDHDTVTLQQAADNKLTGLKDQMKKCNQKKEEVQDAIDKIEEIEKEIISSADEIKCELNTRKVVYVQEVENVFKSATSDVDRLKTEHINKLAEIKYCLNGKMMQINSIKEQGEHLVATGSNSEIVSNCTSDMSCSFQKVIDLEVNEVDENLHKFTPNVPMPVFTCVVGYQWKQIGQISVSDSPNGIAVTSDGKMVVSSSGCFSNSKVQVYTLSGNILHTFQLSSSCISITAGDVFVFPTSNSCKLYSNKYKLLKELEIRDVRNELCTADAVTVDKNGHIILGMHKFILTEPTNTISIHSPDGRVQACFAPSISPQTLAVTSKEEIVIANNFAIGCTLQLFDYTGKHLHTIEPPPEVTEWKPTHVCCSTKDDVFVMNQGDPKAIYKYAAGRVYMGCVTTEVSYTWGIALSHDDQKLFVGDRKDKSNYVIKIFQASYSLAEKIDENFLQCGICLEPYKNPRGLPCLHSFCEECLVRWAKTNMKDDSKVLTCPNCMRQTPIPAKGIEGFPAHFLVNSLQDTLNMEKVKEDLSSKLCDNCEEPEKTAAVYCLDCKHYLCQSCHNIHEAWKGNKSHTVLTGADMLSRKTSGKEQYCTEHDNVEQKFYCETCDKPICKDCNDSKQWCRDHDTITLQQAADYKLTGLNMLKDKLKKCTTKKREIEEIEEEIISSADKIICELNSRKNYYVQKVENVFKRATSDVDRLKTEHIKKLAEIKYCLNGKMMEINSIKEQGEHSVATGSNSEIVSNCTSDMSCSFQKVIDLEVNKIDENLHHFTPNVPMPVFTCVVGYQWKQIGQVSVSDSPRGIAVTSDGKMVVPTSSRYSSIRSKVQVYTLSGAIQHTFRLSSTCISITAGDVFVFPTSNSCKLYNKKYMLLNEFETNVENELYTADAVTVDKNGHIILGMYKYRMLDEPINTISIHSPDGTGQDCFETPISPQTLAVTSKEEIVIADGEYTLQLLDYTGKCLHTIEPPPEVTEWKPTHVCCSTKDDVFVMNQGDPKAIYKYAAGRVYMGCVTTDVRNPWGIAISHDDQKLFIGDSKFKSSKYMYFVKILQAP